MTSIRAISRRDILKYGFAGVIGSAVPLLLTSGEAYAANGGTWRVAFRHQHTGESFNGAYRVGDQYLPEAFERLSYVLRDFRTDETFPMDPYTIDILSTLQRKSGASRVLEVLSGYRSPRTNAMLRGSGSGVARNSLHMYGQAIDIRMPGYSTANLRDMAKSLRAGGVGYYPKSNFVHVDSGDVRSW